MYPSRECGILAYWGSLSSPYLPVDPRFLLNVVDGKKKWEDQKEKGLRDTYYISDNHLGPLVCSVPDLLAWNDKFK